MNHSCDASEPCICAGAIHLFQEIEKDTCFTVVLVHASHTTASNLILLRRASLLLDTNQAGDHESGRSRHVGSATLSGVFLDNWASLWSLEEQTVPHQGCDMPKPVSIALATGRRSEGPVGFRGCRSSAGRRTHRRPGFMASRYGHS